MVDYKIPHRLERERSLPYKGVERDDHMHFKSLEGIPERKSSKRIISKRKTRIKMAERIK